MVVPLGVGGRGIRHSSIIRRFGIGAGICIIVSMAYPVSLMLENYKYIAMSLPLRWYLNDFTYSLFYPVFLSSATGMLLIVCERHVFRTDAPGQKTILILGIVCCVVFAIGGSFIITEHKGRGLIAPFFLLDPHHRRILFEIDHCSRYDLNHGEASAADSSFCAMIYCNQKISRYYGACYGLNDANTKATCLNDAFIRLGQDLWAYETKIYKTRSVTYYVTLAMTAFAFWVGDACCIFFVLLLAFKLLKINIPQYNGLIAALMCVMLAFFIPFRSATEWYQHYYDDSAFLYQAPSVRLVIVLAAAMAFAIPLVLPSETFRKVYVAIATGGFIGTLVRPELWRDVARGIGLLMERMSIAEYILIVMTVGAVVLVVVATLISHWLQLESPSSA